MNARRAPVVASFLLHRLARQSYRESLEGDLLEEFAAGRSALWYWGQVLGALHEHLRHALRRQALPLSVATLFFLVALWIIAPITYRVMGWAGSLETIGLVVVLAWLAGIPFVLGGVAGAAERRRRVGVILLGAAIAYATPVTLPFNIAICDVCSRPAGEATPGAIRVLTPIGAALLAGFGAWVSGKLHAGPLREVRR